MANDTPVKFEETDLIELDETDLDESNNIQSLIDKKKAETGRYKAKLTKEVFDGIVAYVKAGAYVTHAANACGIESATFYRWIDRGLDEPDSIYGLFRTEMMKAFSSAAIRNELIIQRAAPDDWKAAAWYLEKTFPDIYGKNKVSVELSGPDGLPLPAGTNNNEKTMLVISNEEIRKMLEHEMLVNELNALPEEEEDITIDIPAKIVINPNP